MLNRSASLAMSTSVLKDEPGKLDIKIHSFSILFVWEIRCLYLLVSIGIALFIIMYSCITLFKTINCVTLSIGVGIAFSFQLVFGY